MPASSTSPASCMAMSSNRPLRRGASARIDTARRCAFPASSTCSPISIRPPMPDRDDAYKDDVAPEKGSPYRPLYDDKILFNGQPVALVLAEDWDTARFAASLVRVEQQGEPHVTDLHAERDKAFAVEKPEKPRGDAEKAFAAARRAPRGRVFHSDRVPQSDGTVRLDGDLERRQACGLRQDARRAERAAISLRRVRDASRTRSA